MKVLEALFWIAVILGVIWSFTGSQSRRVRKRPPDITIEVRKGDEG